MTKDPKFSSAKEEVLKNLETIQMNWVECVDEGMIDPNNNYYNEIVDLITDAHIVAGWDQLSGLIDQAKTLEKDIAAWQALHGRNTVSFPWPSIPQ